MHRTRNGLRIRFVLTFKLARGPFESSVNPFDNCHFLILQILFLCSLAARRKKLLRRSSSHQACFPNSILFQCTARPLGPVGAREQLILLCRLRSGFCFVYPCTSTLRSVCLACLVQAVCTAQFDINSRTTLEMK